MSLNSAVTNTVLRCIISAFTLPLPLFPRLIDFYTVQESHDPTTLLARSLAFFRYTRARLTSLAPGTYAPSGIEGGGITANYNKKWDVVLLGGAMGSVFSLCQCVISPFLGTCEFSGYATYRVGSILVMLTLSITVSDRYGRKKVLLATMIGNILSALIWLQSTTFASTGSTSNGGNLGLIPSSPSRRARTCCQG
jgi:hypothetical protein